jgi:hypothetical protein
MPRGNCRLETVGMAGFAAPSVSVHVLRWTNHFQLRLRQTSFLFSSVAPTAPPFWYMVHIQRVFQPLTQYNKDQATCNSNFCVSSSSRSLWATDSLKVLVTSKWAFLWNFDSRKLSCMRIRQKNKNSTFSPSPSVAAQNVLAGASREAIGLIT